ncbi:ANTAR domain-containing protein [Blastococcus sp. SYSU D00695]
MSGPPDEDRPLSALFRGAAGSSPAQNALEELAELSVAHEELRVAEAEMRRQRAQIEELLGRHQTDRRWRTHLAALVPVGLCTTDGTGKLLDANPALASLLGVALERLHGKPLAVYLAPAGVLGFRAALRDLGSGRLGEHRATVDLRTREGEVVRREILGFGETAAARATDARVQWLVLPADGAARPATAATGDDAPGDTLGPAAALAELTALGVADHDRRSMLARMAAVVRSAVPGAHWTSITIGSPAEPQWLGSDSPEAQHLDGLQVRAQEGPCWSAHAEGTTVVTGHLATDPRWPRLGPLAAGSPVRSVLAVPVHGGDGQAGVLNVYARSEDAFGGDARRPAELAAAAMTAVLQSVAERESLRALAANLERALTSRAVIDQAKGVLMARLGVSADNAFARLVALSNRLNVKVRDLAALVVSGHADEVIAAAR